MAVRVGLILVLHLSVWRKHLGLEGEAEDDDTGLEVWELEVRRRVFWTLFMQDCVGSSRHGRPSVMQDQNFMVSTLAHGRN